MFYFNNYYVLYDFIYILLFNLEGGKMTNCKYISECDKYINPTNDTCVECDLRYCCWAEPISTATINWLEEMTKLEDGPE